jgi:hypothetical protein
MDVAQVLTTALVSVAVAAASAWCAGTLGVKRALEQAKQQKAFDRRLEWSEKAFRSIARFRLSTSEFVLGFPFRDPDETAKLLKALEKSSGEVDDCLHESLLFAERTVIRQLVSLRSTLFDTMLSVKRINLPDSTEQREVARKLIELNRTMREVNRAIAQEIRDQLGLDEIFIEDLETDAEKRLKQIAST